MDTFTDEPGNDATSDLKVNDAPPPHCSSSSSCRSSAVALLTLALETRKPQPPAPTFVPAPPRNVVNFAAPDFELPLLDGLTLVSPADYAGRPLFLNFWATWCAPCVRELPAFAEFVAQHAADDSGPALLTVNLGEPAAVISSFLDEIGISNLPVAMDINQVVKRDYGVQNLPTTFVIDGDGRIRYMKLGEMTSEDMEAYLQRLGAARCLSPMERSVCKLI